MLLLLHAGRVHLSCTNCSTYPGQCRLPTLLETSLEGIVVDQTLLLCKTVDSHAIQMWVESLRTLFCLSALGMFWIETALSEAYSSDLDIGYPKKQTQGIDREATSRVHRRRRGSRSSSALGWSATRMHPKADEVSPQDLHRSCSRFEAGRVMSCAFDAVQEGENI